MIKKLGLILIAFLLIIPTVYAFNSSTSSYSIESYHIGSAGNEPETSSYSSRSTTTYQQGGSSFESSSYQGKSKWLADTIILAEEELVSEIDITGGDGGGGGGSITIVEFDLETIYVDSPIEPGEYLDFTYSVKNKADVPGDVILEYWLEKDGEIFVIGSDVFFIDSLEEQIKSTSLFLPSTISEGVYTLHIKLTRGGYEVETTRSVEVKLEVPLLLNLIIVSIPEIVPDSPWDYSFLVGVNKDESVQVSLEQRITKSGETVVFKQSELIIDRSGIFSISVRGLESGEYRLELTATSGEQTATATESFTVGEPTVIPFPIYGFFSPIFIIGLVVLLIIVFAIYIIYIIIKKRKHRSKRNAKVSKKIKAEKIELQKFVKQATTKRTQLEKEKKSLDQLEVKEKEIEENIKFLEKKRGGSGKKRKHKEVEKPPLYVSKKDRKKRKKLKRIKKHQ